MVKLGKLKVYLEEYIFEILKAGDFFGEGGFLFGVPAVFRIQALTVSEVYHIDSRVLRGIPIVHWKLYETYEKRMQVIMNPRASSIPIFEWREEFNTNVKALDKTHKKLFEMANRLYEGIHSGQARSAKEDALNFLIQYTQDHFSEEEQLLKKYEYPELESHQRKHEYLKKEILHYKRRFDANESVDDIEFIKFVKDWIVDHILTVDRKYGPFLNKMGVF